MAKLAIMQHERRSDDPYLDVGILKADDVVCVVDDTHKWSAYELSLPCFKFLDIPGAKVEDLSAYLTSEVGDPIQNKMLKARAFKLDSVQLGVKTSVSLPEVLAVKVLKAATPDPNIIGEVDSKEIIR